MTPSHSSTACPTPARGKSARTAAAALVVGTALAALLSGCADDKGGDTTCGDFLGQDAKTQKETVTDYLKSEDSATSGANVNMTLVGITAYCNTVGDADSPISDAKDSLNGGGNDGGD